MPQCNQHDITSYVQHMHISNKQYSEIQEANHWHHIYMDIHIVLSSQQNHSSHKKSCYIYIYYSWTIQFTKLQSSSSS